MKALLFSFVLLIVSGCSVFGDSSVEIAPYTVIEKSDDTKIEIRNYDSMVLVSAPMGSSERNGAFRKLFNYISGDNVDTAEIPMTAPVFMSGEDQPSTGVKIPMTAPVFMGDSGNDVPMMSFVMPENFTLENTPTPKDPDVKVHEIRDYTVAAIIFSGRLSQNNIQKHRDLLEQWIKNEGYIAIGPTKTAGYNAPFTLPAMRRNEVLIPIQKAN